LFTGLLVPVLISGCGALDRGKQVRSVGTMQAIVAKLEDVRRLGPTGLYDRPRMQALIQSVERGRDGWGHELLYLVTAAQRGPSYVLVSLGSDGKLDVSDPVEYFNAPPSRIVDEPWRDIVFRDGKQVTLAGK
jgi:hypothetical protein